MDVTASDARANLYKLIEQVDEQQEIVGITLKGKRVFLVPEDELGSLQEMTHLFGNPANGQRLYKALEDVEAGRNLVQMADVDAANLLERAIEAAERMQPKSA